MNKATEIQILRETVERLGKDSYCGPWLAGIIGEVERDIRSDFFPTASFAEACRTCNTIVTEAENRATSLLIEAATRAEEIRRSATTSLQTEIEQSVKRLLVLKDSLTRLR